VEILLIHGLENWLQFMKNRNYRGNYRMVLGLSFLLTFVGLLVLATTSAPSALAEFGDSFYYLKRQLLHGILPGLLLGILAYKLPLNRFRKITPYLLIANLGLLVLLFLPYLGTILGGSRRWLRLGPISFQPAELLKIVFILYFAHIAAEFTDRKEYRKLFGSFTVLIIVIGALMIFQPDLSTLGVIIAIALTMYFAAGMPFGNILMIGSLVALCFWLFTRFSSYRLMRLLTFLDPGKAPLAAGYQIKQMLYAIGSGGLFGLGLGLSRQKFGFLPHSISDSIFAIIAEELGFIGSLLLIALFVTWIWFAFRIAIGHSDRYRYLLSIGIMTWISIQAFIHIAANIGLIPLTGMPLPFISYGGSALTTQIMAIGFLINDSKT